MNYFNGIRLFLATAVKEYDQKDYDGFKQTAIETSIRLSELTMNIFCNLEALEIEPEVYNRSNAIYAAFLLDTTEIKRLFHDNEDREVVDRICDVFKMLKDPFEAFVHVEE